MDEMKKLGLLLVLTSLVTMACALILIMRRGGDVPYQDITTKVWVEPKAPAQLVFHSQSEWADWCRTNQPDGHHRPGTTPSVDVDHGEVIIVAAMGEMPDASRGIRITEIRETRTSIDVHVRQEEHESAPCAVSYPCQIVLLKDRDKPVRFVNEAHFLFWTAIIGSAGVLSLFFGLALLWIIIKRKRFQVKASP